MKRVALITVIAIAALLGCGSPPPPSPAPGSCVGAAAKPRGTITHHGRTYKLTYHAPKHNRRFAVYRPMWLSVTNLPASDTEAVAVLSPAYDQGQQGSCTANGTVRILQYDFARDGLDAPMFSRSFEYWETRKTEGTETQDSGCSVYDAIETPANIGAVTESEMPYNDKDFTTAPTSQMVTDAARVRAVSPIQIDLSDIRNLKAWIAEGNIAAFGIQVYSSFESQGVADTGEVPVPCPASEQLLGGHCVDAVGYDDNHVCLDGSHGAFLIVNSWGGDWGCQPAGAKSRGYAWISYTFFDPSLNLVSDCNGFAKAAAKTTIP